MFSYVLVMRTVLSLIILCISFSPSFGQVSTGDTLNVPPLKNGQPDQASKQGQNDIKRLTLADCVILALKNNIDLKNTFLNRITQRFSIRVAENKFRPQGNIALITQRSSTYPDIGTGRTTGSTQTANTSVTLNVPTAATSPSPGTTRRRRPMSPRYTGTTLRGHYHIPSLSSRTPGKRWQPRIL